MKRYLITTLGCKVNQCESAAIAHLLGRAGLAPGAADRDADIVVINTCAVTGKAAMQSRQAVRQAVRNHPRAKIVVTGCYAQTSPDDIANISGIDLILGHADKLETDAYLDALEKDRGASPVLRQAALRPVQFAPLPPVTGIDRTRAFLKIQDGCDTFCTYCIVPHARGPSRSMPPADVADHLDRLGSEGFREVVLTGIHLGAYGLDRDPPLTLAGLLAQVTPKHAVDRIRLSSIEPTEVDNALVRLAADPQSGLCRHFHIPLQSGDDQILTRMGRPYGRKDYAEIITTIRRALPDAAIGADVMVGFPGESEAAFDNTCRLIAALPITYLHVFPFSARQGTPAAAFKPRIPADIVKARGRHLREMGQRKKVDFFRSQIGRHIKMLCETHADPDTGLAKGLGDNYVPILLSGSGAVANQLVDVVITAVHPTGALLGTRVV